MLEELNVSDEVPAPSDEEATCDTLMADFLDAEDAEDDNEGETADSTPSSDIGLPAGIPLDCTCPVSHSKC